MYEDTLRDHEQGGPSAGLPSDRTPTYIGNGQTKEADVSRFHAIEMRYAVDFLLECGSSFDRAIELLQKLKALSA